MLPTSYSPTPTVVTFSTSGSSSILASAERGGGILSYVNEASVMPLVGRQSHSTEKKGQPAQGASQHWDHASWRHHSWLRPPKEEDASAAGGQPSTSLTAASGGTPQGSLTKCVMRFPRNLPTTRV